VNTAKAKFMVTKLVLSGVLRGKGVTWRRVGATNDRLEWVSTSVGDTFVEPNSWIRDLDFGMDGLHLNINRARELGDRHCRVCGIDG